MSKGGGSSGPSEVTQITTNLPEYARPYFEDMLGRTVYETARPYEAYPGQRIADFTPYEQMGMRGMYDMAAAGAPSQLGMASDIASQLGYQGGSLAMTLLSLIQGTKLAGLVSLIAPGHLLVISVPQIFLWTTKPSKEIQRIGHGIYFPGIGLAPLILATRRENFLPEE